MTAWIVAGGGWRTVVARLLNLALWLTLCLLAGTGYLLFVRLQHGRRAGWSSLWGLARHDWAEIHAWCGWLFLALIAAHLLLHARWLMRVATPGRRWPVWVGLSVGLAVVAAFVWG